MLADGQPETGTAETAGGGVFCLGKPFEYLLPVLGRDSDSIVHDGDPDIHRIRVGRFRLDPDRDVAFRREFDRIAHEIDENLADPDRIARQRGENGPDVLDLEADAFFAGQGTEHRNDLADQSPEIERHRLQFDLTRLDLREVEDVIDDRDEGGPGGPRDLDELPLVVVEFRRAEKIDRAENAIHRRSDFVTHRRQEIRFGPSRLLRHRPGLFEFAIRPFEGAHRPLPKNETTQGIRDRREEMDLAFVSHRTIGKVEDQDTEGLLVRHDRNAVVAVGSHPFESGFVSIVETVAEDQLPGPGSPTAKALTEFDPGTKVEKRTGEVDGTRQLQPRRRSLGDEDSTLLLDPEPGNRQHLFENLLERLFERNGLQDRSEDIVQRALLFGTEMQVGVTPGHSVDVG